MDRVVISKLIKEDIAHAAKLIQTLHDKQVKIRNDIFISKEENWEDYLESKMLDSSYVVFIAHVDEKVVGVCEAEIKHLGDGQNTKVRDILFIDYIAVDKDYRGCKLGTKLLDEIKSFAKENRISSVELNVWGFNTGAIEFYEKNEMKPKRIVYEYFIDKE